MSHGSNVVTTAVTVDTTTQGGEVLVAGRTLRRSVIVQNLSATVDVYVGAGGASGVTTTNGLKVAAGASLDFGDFSGPLYGVVAASSADVRVMEVY